MGVYIKGMAMPKVCAECFMDPPCRESFHVNIWKERHPGCPLIEIPPHGRLGDLDELKSKFRHSEGDDDVDSAWISAVRRIITQAETIIEAEGSST